jgi:transcriptional regulator with XRE-family HTH domain
MPALDPPLDLGSQLRARRNERKLSLRELERRSGINSGYLSQLERGEIAKPTPSVLQKVASAYDVPFQIVMRWAGYVEDGLSPNAQRALSVLGDDFTDEELAALRAVLDVLRGKRAASFRPDHRSDLLLDPVDIDVIRRHALQLLRDVGEHDADGPVDLEAVAASTGLARCDGIELTADERQRLHRRFGALADRATRILQGAVLFGPGEVYVNPDLYTLKQNFVLAHEIGHWTLPDHRITYAALDDHTRLTPDFDDLLERQANRFAIELLARGDRLRDEWDDGSPSVAKLQALSTRYAISLQATARRIAEDSRRPVAVAVAHRLRAWGPLQPPRLFCSAVWERRMAWRSGRMPVDELRARLEQVRRGIELPPLITTDLSGRDVGVEMQGIDTARARLLLCWWSRA